MKRVLIIDGHLPSLNHHKAMLFRDGYDVVGEATDGKVGLILACTSKIDAVILAANLPDMDWTAVAAEIMKSCPIAIVLIDHQCSSAFVEKGLAAGVMAILLTPVSEQQLTAVLEIAIARFHAYRILQEQNLQLKENLEARKLIERAKGVLMEQRALSEDQAYQLLKKSSMNLRKPMVEIAQAILLSRGLLSAR